MKKIVVLILGVFLFSGCMTSRFDVSRPVASLAKGVLPSGENLNFQNRIDISVKPCNFTNRASFIMFGSGLPARFLYKGEKVFYVELGFKPRESGFTFDPSSVILKTDSFTLSPVEVLGPLSTQEIYLNSLFNFNESRRYVVNKNIDLSTVSGSISLERKQWTGVLLKFNTYPPVPESNFSLSLKGLSDANGPVELDVDFVKGSAVLMDNLE